MTAATAETRKKIERKRTKRTHDATKIKVKYQIYIFFCYSTLVSTWYAGAFRRCLVNCFAFRTYFLCPFRFVCLCAVFPLPNSSSCTYLVSFATFRCVHKAQAAPAGEIQEEEKKNSENKLRKRESVETATEEMFGDKC